MKLIINYNNHKTTIIFIHGFRKKYDDFNETENNKHILIETRIRTKCNTIMIQIEENDYKKEISEISEQMYYHLLNAEIMKTKITIVAHSYGSFYAFYLAEKYPIIFGKILLIDPTIKTINYKNKLIYNNGQKIENDSTEFYKLKNFDTLSDGINIKSTVIIRIHTNLNSNELIMDLNLSINTLNEFSEKMQYLNKLVNKNIKSRLIMHVDCGHMIHYKKPDLIIDSIMELYKL